MTIGEKIEGQRRNTPGMTQEELAERIGISAQSYRNYIMGKSSAQFSSYQLGSPLTLSTIPFLPLGSILMLVAGSP